MSGEVQAAQSVESSDAVKPHFDSEQLDAPVGKASVRGSRKFRKSPGGLLGDSFESYI